MKSKRNIHDILTRYLPRAPQHEMEAAGREVLSRLHAEMEKRDTSLRSLSGDGWSAAPLDQREFRVLSAASLLGMRASVVKITEIAKNWAGGISDPLVFVTLSRLQERGLVAFVRNESTHENGGPRFHYEPTEDGERALSRARQEGKQLENAREVKGGIVQRVRQFLKL